MSWESKNQGVIIRPRDQRPNDKEIITPANKVSNIYSEVPVLNDEVQATWIVEVEEFEGNWLCFGALEKRKSDLVKVKFEEPHYTEASCACTDNSMYNNGRDVDQTGEIKRQVDGK